MEEFFALAVGAAGPAPIDKANWPEWEARIVALAERLAALEQRVTRAALGVGTEFRVPAVILSVERQVARRSGEPSNLGRVRYRPSIPSKFARDGIESLWVDLGAPDASLLLGEAESLINGPEVVLIRQRRFQVSGGQRVVQGDREASHSYLVRIERVGGQETQPQTAKPEAGQETHQQAAKAEAGQETQPQAAKPEGDRRPNLRLLSPKGGQETQPQVAEPEAGRETQTQAAKPVSLPSGWQSKSEMDAAHQGLKMRIDDLPELLKEKARLFRRQAGITWPGAKAAFQTLESYVRLLEARAFVESRLEGSTIKLGDLTHLVLKRRAEPDDLSLQEWEQLKEAVAEWEETK